MRTPKHKLGKKTEKAVVKLIKREISEETETKYFDSQNTSGPLNYDTVTDSGILYPLFSPVQGSAQAQRVGDEISYKNIILRMVAYAAGVPAGNFSLRMILFKWHPEVALHTPVVADILHSFWTGDVAATCAPYVYEKRTNFTILEDRVMIPRNNSNGSLIHSIHKKLRGKLVFQTGAATGSNGLYLILISDTSGGCSVVFQSRTFYKDA